MVAEEELELAVMATYIPTLSSPPTNCRSLRLNSTLCSRDRAFHAGHSTCSTVHTQDIESLMQHCSYTGHRVSHAALFIHRT